MRISLEEKLNIQSVFLPFRSKGFSFTLFLVGSRTDDSKKGGDLDLLLLAKEEEVDELRKNRTTFLAELKAKLGDQKIDLILTSKERIDKDALLTSIFSKKIELI